MKGIPSEVLVLRRSALVLVLGLLGPAHAQTFHASSLSDEQQRVLQDARAHEARGDEGQAFRLYLDFLHSDHDALDVALRVAAMARARIGGAPARDLMGQIGGNPALRLAAATLSDVAERRRVLEAFVTAHPDYGPAYALLAAEYAQGRLEDQPLRDRLRERDLLSRFLGFDAQGKLAASFTDSTVLAVWLERAERRLAAIDARLSGAAAAPTANFSRSNSSWLVYLNMPEPPHDIRYRVGDDGPLVSTGVSRSIDMRTGRRNVNMHFQLPLDTPRTTIHVTYLDGAGREVGPFGIAFDPREIILKGDRKTLDDEIPGWANFADGQTGREWLYFNTLMYARCAIRKAEYGFNGPPNREFPLPPCNLSNPHASPADAQSAVKMLSDTRSVSVRLTFNDGTVETRSYRVPGR
jgi:hypothetical protein